MERKTENNLTLALIIDVCVALWLWLLLIVCKITGDVDMHWAIVLSGIVWITWLLMVLTCMIILLARLYGRMQRWRRRRKVERRIIAQAKAVGAWEKPMNLGGRALELKAWQDFKIKRFENERDAQLRHRCMREGERASGRVLTRYAYEWMGIPRQPHETDDHLRCHCYYKRIKQQQKRGCSANE